MPPLTRKAPNILDLHFKINTGFKDTYLKFIKLVIIDKHLIEDESIKRIDLNGKIHSAIRVLIRDYADKNRSIV